MKVVQIPAIGGQLFRVLDANDRLVAEFTREDDAWFFVGFRKRGPTESLRDRFAGRAMAALLSSPSKVGDGNLTEANVSRMAYVIADAMLVERAK